MKVLLNCRHNWLLWHKKRDLCMDSSTKKLTLKVIKTYLKFQWPYEYSSSYWVSKNPFRNIAHWIDFVLYLIIFTNKYCTAHKIYKEKFNIMNAFRLLFRFYSWNAFEYFDGNSLCFVFRLSIFPIKLQEVQDNISWNPFSYRSFHLL